MTRRLTIQWWLSFVGLGPLLWVQGRYARWRTPRLPPPAEPLQGRLGHEGKTFQLLVLGESPAAGIGVSTRDESLPAQLAAAIHQRSERVVQWRSLAVNGATIQDVLQQQWPQARGECLDLVVVVIGVNDTTGLTARQRWRASLRELITRIRADTPAPILFASLPRMDSFTALPQPLRTVIGIRARVLDQDLRAVAAATPGVACAKPLPPLSAAQLSADGYHPSAQACRDWACQLADAMDAG